MAQKYPFIKVNMTQAEKDRISDLAKQNHRSVSAFVKDQIAPLLRAEEFADVPYSYEADDRKHVMRVPVSQKEFATIRAKAGDQTIAAYVRDTALSGKKTIRVEVYDDDIVDLMHRVQPQIDAIFGIAKALQLQKQLQPAQFARLDALLSDIQRDIRSVTADVRENRSSIRQTRLRELRRRCDYAMKTQSDSLACFED